ncbi:uncharacterized protein LOC143916097 [Arctopsyche grandis]|uniref:uncharacterized protein LOC143916097 n=1 Tax=Arctopsyche grandis TaxID=121162 RepID=UPI00406D8D72
MKIPLLLVALASVALAAPYEGYFGVKTSTKHRGNNVRLICENGLCVLKTFQDMETESSTTEAGKAIDQEPAEIATEITDVKTVEEERGDQPVVHQEMDSNEDSDEHHDQHEADETHIESDEHHEADEAQHESDEHHEADEAHHESDEHHEEDETHHESDEHHEADEGKYESDEHHEAGQAHNESDEHQEEKETKDESSEEHAEIEDRNDQNEKYTTMVQEEHDISQSGKDHDEHEDHTLSVDLMPPHEESVWNTSNDKKQNDEDSVIYKIPQDDRKYVKGVKDVKTPFRL